MLMAKEWLKTWICLSFLFAWVQTARPRFDVSTDMSMVLVPADAEIETAIFRLRATDQDADFPLVFEIIATTSPVVRIENLPCTFYNKVCQANVILTRRLVPGRLHDFIVRVRDSTGDMNSMQATISVTNATTPRDRIFPHLPTLIMVPEDTKPEKELDYLLVESNPWSGKPVYIELWQPKELFKIRQRQVGSQTKGIITLIGELDFETQSMYTLTMYATDPYTEPGKDTRNIAGINVVVAVVDVQDVPPIFTLAPPLTKINNTVKPGDVILRVHAEDGDKGVPREVTYGLISEGNPFTPFFNVSETTGEIILSRPLEELTKITHVGAPIILKIVAEEIRTTRDEPPAQATVVELGLLLGEPGNSPPYFENDNYVAWINENVEPGTIIVFSDAYSTRVKDEDIGKAGVFALKLENNNNTFEISPAVAERSASFVITVRDNSLIDYEKFKSLRFKIVAQEVGPATNLSTSVPVTIFLRDMNDNPPVFDVSNYEVTLSENANAGTRVVQVHATDKDAGVFGRIQYMKIMGAGSEAFEMNPDTGLITVSMGSFLDREQTSKLELTVEAKDEDGRGLRGVTNLIVNIIDTNDNVPIFERGIYDFILNNELTNFTMPAFIKASDSDAEPPNNQVRYEIVHGNYDSKFVLNEITGQLMLREPITKIRKIRDVQASNITSNKRKELKISKIELSSNQTNTTTAVVNSTTPSPFRNFHLLNNLTSFDDDKKNQSRRRRAEDTPLFILTARAYDLGVPHLSSVTQIRILRPMSAFARIVMFVMPGENPDPKKTAETLATITGSRVTIMEIKPYDVQANPNNSDIGKRSVVVARVEQYGPGTLVDVDKIRASLADNGFGIISGMDGNESTVSTSTGYETNSSNNGRDGNGVSMIDEEVTVYKAENKLLTWLLILLGLLILAALVTAILCCVCSSCPFYMEPRKRRIHSSETLIIRSDGRPKRHLHRQPIKADDRYYNERKEAWSADPERQQWQFNRRNTKNLGIASLPGDVHQNAEISGNRQQITSLRQYDAIDAFGERVPRVIQAINHEDDRMYLEDVEAQRNFEQAEMDSLRRHELERGSDGVLRNNGAFAVAAAAAARQERLREQHYYREGNAEVLRLVTRGEIEERKEMADRTTDLYQPNGKDILLQRFIEDQKLRRSQDSFNGGSLHEVDIDRSMESHQRANEIHEILILPERLEMQRQPSYVQRPQDQMINVDIQRLVTEHPYKSDAEEYRSPRDGRASMRDVEVEAEITTSGHDRNATFGMHDSELVRQNALLTRLLLEKEARSGLNVPVVDSSSFLETQSLPGQVAIATQTDRTASTQTEYFGRSRSDNEETEEDPRLRRKSKGTHRVGKLETKEDSKKTKTIWVTTPIPEESRAQSANKKTPTRTKIEVTESSRKVSISPDVLKEISNSLDSDNNTEEQHEVKRKVATKMLCTKKVKESRIDDDSTTPSPEAKEKSISLKSKVRKKPEKPPRKKLEKRLDTEKSHFMEPSFRVLEREISSFQQKIKEFGDKKLKMLKKDDNKKAKESEDDSGATYDVSKKCEVTVKRMKKSLSRETSPTKISVEQKTKNSDEEKKSHQNISSSDLEDSDKSRQQASTFSERTTQYESSRMETRGRSQLRRQPHMETSDFTKSSSEKIEDSKSSSSDLKLDSSQDLKKKSHGKYLQSQRAATKRPVDVKRRVASVKSKISEQKTKKLTTTSDESKLSSPVKKTTVSEEDEKLKATSSSDDKSKLSAAIGIDIDKLVEDVRGVVEKEIQNAREAMNVVKLEESVNDEKSDQMKKSSKSIEVQKSLAGVESKAKSQSLDSSKKEMTPMEKRNLQRAIDAKEKKEKSMKEKSKSVGSTSPTKNKTDEAVTFVIFENDKIRREPSPKISKSLDKLSQDVSKPRESMQSIQIISKPLEIKSDKVVEKKDDNVKKISEKVEETNKVLTGSIDETIKPMASKIEQIELKELNSIGESREKISDEITEEMKNIDNEKIEETKQNISSQINESKQSISSEAEETKQSVSKIINEPKLSITSQIDESKRDISSSVEDIKQSVVDMIDETKQSVSNKIDKTDKNMSKAIQDSSHSILNITDQAEKSVSEQMDQIKEDISSRIDDTRQSVSQTIEDTKQSISHRIDESKQTISSQIEDSKQSVSQTIDDTKQSFSNGIDEVNASISNTINSTIENVSETIDHRVKNLTEGANDATKILANEIDENPQAITDETKDYVETVSDKIADTKTSISNEITEIHEIKSDKIEKTSSSGSTSEKLTITHEKSQESQSKIPQSFSMTSSPNKKLTSATSDTKIEPDCITSRAYLCGSKSASLPSEMKELEESETKNVYSKSDEESSSLKAEKSIESIKSKVTEQKVEESIEETKQTEKSRMVSTSLKAIEKTEVNSSKVELEKERVQVERSRSPTKLFKPISPVLKVTETTTNEDESDEESSSASDISNKTALQTQPYRTPRHSMSSDGGADKVSESKPRQRWDKEPLLKVEMPKQAKASFPKKMEVPSIDKSTCDQAKSPKLTTAQKDTKETEKTHSNKEAITRPTIVGVKRKDHLRTDHFSRLADNRRASPRRETTHQSRSSKVEIRSKHLKLQVSHHYRQPKDGNDDDASETAASPTTTTINKAIDHGKDPEIANARSRYMAWYQQKRTEMERKRREKKEAEEEQSRTKWMKRPVVRSRKAKSAEDPDQHKTDAKQTSRSRERAKSSSEAAQNATTPRVNRLRIRPLINVESEQLKAIVRQGRKLRKKEGGGTEEDLTVQIFAPEKPPAEKIEEERLTIALQLQPRHHLTQHSEYKYEKNMLPTALPFYLHPLPPPPNPSPEAFQDELSENRRLDDDLDSGIAVSLQGGTTRLKHQQVLEKKSVFDIAYSEAAPTQLRSDSSTPPS